MDEASIASRPPDPAPAAHLIAMPAPIGALTVTDLADRERRRPPRPDPKDVSPCTAVAGRQPLT